MQQQQSTPTTQSQTTTTQEPETEAPQSNAATQEEMSSGSGAASETPTLDAAADEDTQSMRDAISAAVLDMQYYTETSPLLEGEDWNAPGIDAYARASMAARDAIDGFQQANDLSASAETTEDATALKGLQESVSDHQWNFRTSLGIAEDEYDVGQEVERLRAEIDAETTARHELDAFWERATTARELCNELAGFTSSGDILSWAVDGAGEGLGAVIFELSNATVEGDAVLAALDQMELDARTAESGQDVEALEALRGEAASRNTQYGELKATFDATIERARLAGDAGRSAAELLSENVDVLLQELDVHLGAFAELAAAIVTNRDALDGEIAELEALEEASESANADGAKTALLALGVAAATLSGNLWAILAAHSAAAGRGALVVFDKAREQRQAGMIMQVDEAAAAQAQAQVEATAGTEVEAESTALVLASEQDANSLALPLATTGASASSAANAASALASTDAGVIGEAIPVIAPAITEYNLYKKLVACREARINLETRTHEVEQGALQQAKAARTALMAEFARLAQMMALTGL